MDDVDLSIRKAHIRCIPVIHWYQSHKIQKLEIKSQQKTLFPNKTWETSESLKYQEETASDLAMRYSLQHQYQQWVMMADHEL